MKRIIFLLFIITIGIVSCKNKKETTEKDVVTAEQKNPEVAATNPAKDSAEIRNVIMDFYIWYTKDFAKFQEYNLYSGIKKKDMPPYKINWEEVTKYQDFIRTSVPQLGEEFLASQKRFFQQCDSAFKVDTEDELPYGFDYDWYTNSQEDPEYLLEAINRNKGGWDVSVNGNDATVRISGFNDHRGKQERIHFISLAMKKQKGNWKIAKIGID